MARILAGECYEDKVQDKRLVCEVILNRVSNDDFGDTILDVLTEKISLIVIGNNLVLYQRMIMKLLYRHLKIGMKMTVKHCLIIYFLKQEITMRINSVRNSIKQIFKEE